MSLAFAITFDNYVPTAHALAASYLLIDSRPRKVVLALPPVMPVPLLSVALDTIFSRFQAPIISLLSSPVSTAFAAGVRSALVVDMGWHETVVTAIYEYREVACTRSIRAGKALVHETHRLLARAVASQGGRGESADDSDGSDAKRVVSFAECEDVVARVVWCKPVVDEAPRDGAATKEESSPDGLTTVAEQDESDAEMPPPPPATAPSLPTDPATDNISIPLTSTTPPTTVKLPFELLAEPCERAFFDTQYSRASFDDHELPLHHLVYEHLAGLPMDVRSVCMSRIVFTGGCAGVLGLRGRVFDEVDRIARHWGWDAVRGKIIDKRRAEGPPRARLKEGNGSSNGSGPAAADSEGSGNRDAKPTGQEEDGVWHDAANAVPAPDPIEAHMRRQQQQQQQQQSAKTGVAARKLPEPPDAGDLRAIESLGPWAGASLLSQLRVPAIATVDRDQWLLHGAAGASRVSEVDLKAQHRQSTRPGEFISRAAAGSTANTNWTLGVWGTLQ